MDELMEAVDLAIDKWLDEFMEIDNGDEFVTIFNNCVLVVSIENGELRTHFIGGNPYKIDMTLGIYENKEQDMTNFEDVIEERNEPFTLDEVFSFIDDTSIGTVDACELKSRIVDVVLDARNKALDDLIKKCDRAKFVESDEIALSDIHQGTNSGLSMAMHFAEQLKAGVEND